MRGAGLIGVLAIGGLALGGCSDGLFSGDSDSIFGDPSRAKQEDQGLTRAQEIAAKVPVQAVQSIEMGRTRDGFMITAVGTAPGLGYSLPSLRPRRNGAPGADGYIEYDFVAVSPPEGFNLPPGNTQTRRLRADLPLTLPQLQGAAGLRVLALSGGVQMDF